MKDIILNKNISLTSIAFFFIFMGFGPVEQYLLPLLKLHGRESDALTSLIFIYVAFFISSIIAPKFINMLGSKKSIILGGLTYVLFSLSVVINSTPILYVASLILGCGASFLWITSTQIITDSSSKETGGKNLGFQYSILLIGNLLGISLSTLLINTLSLEQFYLIFSGVTAIGVLFFVPLKTKTKISISNKFEFKFFFKPQLLLLFPIIFASKFYAAQTIAAVNLVILGAFGLAFVGIFAAFFKISNIVGAFSAGKISDVYNKEFILFISVLLGIIGSFLFIIPLTFPSVTLALVLLGLFTAAVYPVCLSILRQSFSEDTYLYAIGAFNVFGNIGILSALFSTKYLDARSSFIPGVILLFIALPCLYIYKKRYSIKSSS